MGGAIHCPPPEHQFAIAQFTHIIDMLYLGGGSLAYFSDDDSGESSAHEDSDVIDSDRDFSDIDFIQDIAHTGKHTRTYRLENVSLGCRKISGTLIQRNLTRRTHISKPWITHGVFCDIVLRVFLYSRCLI